MKRYLFPLFILSIAALNSSCKSGSGEKQAAADNTATYILSDTQADPLAGILFRNLARLSDDYVLVGHQDALAFVIYAMAEYYLIAHEEGALETAKRLFGLIEKHSFDAEKTATWKPIQISTGYGNVRRPKMPWRTSFACLLSALSILWPPIFNSSLMTTGTVNRTPYPTATTLNAPGCFTRQLNCLARRNSQTPLNRSLLL